MEPPRFSCPACRRPIRTDGYSCPHCGALVALIWEECRVACHFLRLAAVFLLASLIVGVVTVAVADALSMTAVGTGNLAVISAGGLAAAIAIWTVSSVVKEPPPPWETIWSPAAGSPRGRIEAPGKEK